MKKFWNNLSDALAENEYLVAIAAFLGVILFLFVFIPLVVHYPIAVLGTVGAGLLSRLVYAGFTGK